MTLTQIATLLNETIDPAIMGEDFSVNPDLSNVVDIGTKIGDMTAEKFKTYLGKFVAGVAKTYFDLRSYSPEKLPMFIDSQMYGGVVQSVKADFTTITDSRIYNLVTGEEYNDVNKYFGTETDNKVYEKDVAYRIVKSIPKSMYNKMFTSKESITDLVALVEQSIDRTVNRESSALEHNLLAQLGVQGVKIDLVTSYNNMLATGKVGQGQTVGTFGDGAVDVIEGQQIPVTSENCIYNKAFMHWATMVIKTVKESAKFANKKYNDGTVSTWLDSSDSITVLNTSFESALNLIKGNTLHKDEIDLGEYRTTPFWNAQPDALIPTVNNSTHIIYREDNEDKSIDNVVGMVYDRYSVGYTVTPIPARTSYNADGDFVNLFIDVNNKYFTDTRNTAIIFTLN